MVKTYIIINYDEFMRQPDAAGIVYHLNSIGKEAVSIRTWSAIPPDNRSENFKKPMESIQDNPFIPTHL